MHMIINAACDGGASICFPVMQVYSGSPAVTEDLKGCKRHPRAGCKHTGAIHDIHIMNDTHLYNNLVARRSGLMMLQYLNCWYPGVSAPAGALPRTHQQQRQPREVQAITLHCLHHTLLLLWQQLVLLVQSQLQAASPCINPLVNHQSPPVARLQRRRTVLLLLLLLLALVLPGL
jgi:hypothetical protein